MLRRVVCEAQFRAAMVEEEPMFRPTREHSVGLARTFRCQVVNKNAEVAFVALD